MYPHLLTELSYQHPLTDSYPGPSPEHPPGPPEQKPSASPSTCLLLGSLCLPPFSASPPTSPLPLSLVRLWFSLCLCHRVSACLCGPRLWIFSLHHPLPQSSRPLPLLMASPPHSRTGHAIAQSHRCPHLCLSSWQQTISPSLLPGDRLQTVFLPCCTCCTWDACSPPFPSRLTASSGGGIERSGEAAQGPGRRGPPWAREGAVGSSLRDPLCLQAHVPHTCLEGETHLRLQRPCVGATV